MAATVTVNGRTVVHAASEGVSTACPDACSLADGTVVPCFNTAFSKDITNCAKTVFVDGHPVATSASYIATSTGNEHTLGGVISGKVKGKASFINYSMNVFIEGKPVPRNGDPMVHNHGSPFNAISPAIVQPNLSGASDKDRLCEVYCFCRKLGKTLCANRALAEPRYVKSTVKLGTKEWPYPKIYWDPHDPRFYVQVPFDMSAPGGPAPLLDATERMSKPPHHPLPRHEFPPLTGTRRPDGVIAKNPALPLTRQNIDAIFEFKFPPDRFRDKGQREAYLHIAKGKRLIIVDEDNCGASCPKEDPPRKRAPVRERERQPDLPPMFVPLGSREEEQDKRRPVPLGPIIPVLTAAGLLAILARFASALNPAFLLPIMPGSLANPNAGKET